ncbi:MAG TPA: FtsX-like permease family protein [Nitrospiria bacterium]|nr:FtsX-like permease family protein [Nitrospiria bacterium]
MNRFVLKMAWREARSSYRHLLFFLSSIAIGVGSIVGTGNLSANLEAMTLHESRNLIAADLEARLNRPLSPKEEAFLPELAREGVGFIRVTELHGMAMTQDSALSQLVELKAVEPGYPFYGRLRIDPPPSDSTRDPFLDPDAVWVQEALLIRLHLQVGDVVKLGEALFTIRGVIRQEPDRVAGTFSLGPRVLLSQQGLRRTGLIQPGSRITDRYLFKLPPSETPEALKTELSGRWSSESVQIHTYRDAQPRLKRFLENFTTYLGLVGLITLIIGGIGVAGNIHTFLAERIGTIAILKCLGCSSSSILTIYLLLALFLGGIGSLIGIFLGMAVYYALLPFLAGFLPPDFVFRPMPLAAVRGLAMGLLVTLLFSLWPLRMVQRWTPSRVFRQEVEAEGKGFPDRKTWLLAGIILLGCLGLSLWQAGSFRLGGWAAAAIGVAVPLLLAAAWATLGALKRIGRRLSILRRSLILRYGIGNLFRPGRQIVTIVLSIGIGVTILLTLAQVERNLMSQLQQNVPRDAPGLFFIDLQPDQKPPFEGLMKKWDLKRPLQLTPLVRSRLHAVDGKPVSEMQTENRPDGWYFTREYVLTFQRDLPDHNILQRGQWWGGTSGADAAGSIPSISVEAEAARHLGIDLGSTVTFDIQGVLVTGRIASIREVDWGSMTTNFFFIFAPGALDRAPLTYVATASTRPEEDLAIQNAVIGAFPNVTVINLREVLDTIAGILREIIRTVQFMAGFGLLVGLIVLSGAIAATRARRRTEMVLFKTLGATRPTLAAMMAVEYGLLGVVAGIVGGLLSTGLSWGIVHYFLELPWRFYPLTFLIGLAATVIVTMTGGFLTTHRLLGQKPLAVLRSD